MQKAEITFLLYS